MHGFREHEVIQSLVGCELSQVCIGRNEVILQFLPEPASVTVTSLLGFYQENGDLFASLVTGSKDARYIGAEVTSYRIMRRDSMALHLSSTATITLLDDSEKYESVVIQTAVGTFVA